MKCENWSNKVNNFVVRKLKSFKLNGQQQVLSTMPAMPKEKTSPVPLAECNFVEMKMKEQLVSSSSNTTKLISSKMPENILTTGGNETTATQILQQQQQKQNSNLYSSNNSIRTSGGQTELITPSSNNTQLLNGSTNLFHSKNDKNIMILNNGTVNIIMTGLSGSSCNIKNIIKNDAMATITTKQTVQTSSSSSSSSSSSGTTTVNNSGLILTATNGVTPSSTVKQTAIASSSTASSSIASSSSSPPTSSTSNATIKSGIKTTNSNHATGRVNPGMPAKKTAKDYIFGKYIGEGSFSTVYLARDIHTNREYAIKVCDKQHILREKKQDYVRREREIMHIMNNVPGFVNLSCTFQDYRNLYFVMTLAKNGDLLPYINKVGSFDLDCTRHYAAELVLAIENMHKRGVIHRDLKPENILLDESMHTLIADFGSATIFSVDRLRELLSTSSMQQQKKEESSIAAPSSSSSTIISPEKSTSVVTTSNSPNKRRNERNCDEDDDDDDDDDDEDEESDSPRPIRKRRGSFVGTAQYVSPEVLQGEIVTRSADLWALGCIIYQMISGLPPFRGGSDYLIFKEIMNLNLVFPEGFDNDAEDLVRNLLKINPNERIGANDTIEKYESIRSHPFFNGIDWNKIRQNSPPQIYPYLPGVSKNEELRSHYRVPDNLEPGLDDKQLTRLLGLELGTISGVESEKKTEPKNNLKILENDKQKLLEVQKSDKWHLFSEGEVILKKGFINKRKGLFARKRMLLLTTGPRLIYIDPVQMVKKGEIPWSPELRVEPKNFKIFFVHTPNRTYYLEDPEGYALEWVNAIEDVRQKTYGDKS